MIVSGGVWKPEIFVIAKEAGDIVNLSLQKKIFQFQALDTILLHCNEHDIMLIHQFNRLVEIIESLGRYYYSSYNFKIEV